jgi:hypothetical protein
MKLAKTKSLLSMGDNEIPAETQAFLLYHINPYCEEPLVIWADRKFGVLDSHLDIELFDILSENYKPQRIELAKPIAHHSKTVDGYDSSYTFPQHTSAWLLGENLAYLDDDDLILELQAEDYISIGSYDVHIDSGDEMICLHSYEVTGRDHDLHFETFGAAEHAAENQVDIGMINTCSVVEWFEPSHYQTLKLCHLGSWYLPKSEAKPPKPLTIINPSKIIIRLRNLVSSLNKTF